MGLSEANTRTKLIDTALHARGGTEHLIRRKAAAAAIEVIAGQPRKQAKGRIEYPLRVRVNLNVQPIVVALIGAKPAYHPSTRGLERAKIYASCQRLKVPFVFSINVPFLWSIAALQDRQIFNAHS